MAVNFINNKNSINIKSYTVANNTAKVQFQDINYEYEDDINNIQIYVNDESTFSTDKVDLLEAKENSKDILVQMEIDRKKAAEEAARKKVEEERQAKLDQLDELYKAREDNIGILWGADEEKKIEAKIIKLEKELGVAHKADGWEEFTDTACVVKDYTMTAVCSVGEGIVGVGEDIVDGVAMIGGAAVAGGADLVGCDKFADDCRSAVQDFVEADFAGYCYEACVDVYNIDQEIAYGKVHTVGNVVGTVTGYAVLTLATGGAGTAATATSTAVTAVAGGFGAAGSSAQNSFENGATFDEAALTSTVAFGAGAVSGGLLNKAQGAAATATTVRGTVGYTALGVGASTIEPVANSLTEYATYGNDMVDENGNPLYDNVWDYYVDSGGLLNTAIAGTVGGISTGVSGFKFHSANEMDEISVNASELKPTAGSSYYNSSINKNTLEENIIEIIKRHDSKYGEGDALERLNYFINPSNDNYRNYDIITSSNDARAILRMYTPEQIEHALNNLSYSPNTHNISGYFSTVGSVADNTYGVDQGGIASLCKYTYNGNEYTYRQAMELYNDALNNNKPLPHFKKEGNQEYFYLKNKLKSQGFSDHDASVIMSTVDDAGACSYAATVNEIFASFEGREFEFQQKFGYPMYKVKEGKTVLNSNELLLDLYVYSNTARNGGGFILDDNRLNNYFLRNDRTDVFGRRMLDAQDQVYMSYFSSGKNVNVVSNFLNTKGINYNSNWYFSNVDAYSVSDAQFSSLVNTISQEINSGRSVSLDIYQIRDNQGNIIKGNTINMNSTNPNLYGSTSTATWTEGGGHAVFITGVGNDCFYVSSWGKEYSIPFIDLQNGGIFNIFGSTIY